MIVEKLYIPILNFIYKHTSGLSQRTRSILMYSCLTIIIVSTYFYQAKRFFLYDYPAMLNSFIGTCAFIGFLIASIDRKIEMVKIRSWLMYVLMLCGIVIVVSGIHHYIGYSYILMGLFMTFLMPPFIVVWCYRRDFDTLFRCISIIGVSCCCVYYIMSMLLAPVGNNLVDERYAGMAADPNGVAKTAVASYVCAIYLRNQLCDWRKLWICPVIAASISLILLTGSRANLLALVSIIIFEIIIVIKHLHTFHRKTAILRTISVVIFVIIMIPLFIGGLHLKDVYDVSSQLMVASEDGYNQAEKSQNISKNDVSDQHVNEMIDQRIKKGNVGEKNVDLNTASSGRIEIWKYCIGNCNVLGNDVGNGAIMVSNAGRSYYHAHNTILELLLRSGVFASGLFFILELYCAYWILRRVFSKEINTSYELFAVMAITAFGIASLFDIVVLPFAKQTVAMFYLSLPCVMYLKDSVKVENK